MATATSIVDFLKSRGLQPQMGEKFPFYDTRTQLYNKLSMGSSLGDFRGTSEQNTALLQSLMGYEKNTGITITPENLFDVATVGMGGGTTAPTPIVPTPSDDVLKERDKQEEERLKGATYNPETKGWTIPAENTGTTGTTGTLPPSGDTGGDTSGTPAIDATGFLPEIPSAEDVSSLALEQVTRGATYPLQQEAVEAEKEAIRLGSQRQKESFITDIASRGLFFSGAKTKGLKTVEADQLSQILGVDRKFALLIAQGLETAAQDIVKEAQKGRQEAIDSLEALGYAINPITGKIEPTLQAKSAQAQEDRLAAAQQEQVRQFEISQAATQERFAITKQLEADKFNIQQQVAAAQNAFNQAISLDQRRVAQEQLEIAQKNLALKEQEIINDQNQGLTVPTTGTWQTTQNAFLRAIADAPQGQKEFDTNLFNSFMASGDIEQAKEYIVQRAAETAPAATYQQIIGRQSAIDELNGIRTNLQAYTANGGNTNILVGTYDELLGKLGTTADPKLRQIENEIKLALMNYRRAMTGVQFGMQEHQEYEKLFPNYKNTPPTNEASINALLNSFNSYQESFFKQKIGASNYDMLFGAQSKSIFEQYPAPQGGQQGGQQSADDIMKEISGHTTDPGFFNRLGDMLGDMFGDMFNF